MAHCMQRRNIRPRGEGVLCSVNLKSNRRFKGCHEIYPTGSRLLLVALPFDAPDVVLAGIPGPVAAWQPMFP
jgi:hypothetical protein